MIINHFYVCSFKFNFGVFLFVVSGYEVNIVRTAADGTQTPVACYEQYNHHFSAFMFGKAATMDPAPIHPLMSHNKALPTFKIQKAAHTAPLGLVRTEVCSFSGIWLNPANNIEVL